MICTSEFGYCCCTSGPGAKSDECMVDEEVSGHCTARYAYCTAPKCHHYARVHGLSHRVCSQGFSDW